MRLCDEGVVSGEEMLDTASMDSDRSILVQQYRSTSLVSIPIPL